MPKKPIDYSKCKFYRLVCRDPTVTECYVGQTTDESNRRRHHKKACTDENGSKFNYFVYNFLRAHGGWDNWQLLVVETASMKDKNAARLRERYWFEFYNATLNTIVPSRTKSEYHADHRKRENKRSIAWNAAHDVFLKTKNSCACGSKYTTANRCHHIKTARHCAYLASLPAV